MFCFPMVYGFTPFSCVARLRFTFSINSFLDSILAGPVQTQSSEINFSSAELFCCSSFAVSASILRRAGSSEEADTTWLRVEGIERKSPAIKAAHRIRMIYLRNQRYSKEKYTA